MSIDVRAVLPTSEKTFEVEWIETTRDLYGESPRSLEGRPYDGHQPANGERIARVNPLGIYVTNVNWAKVLSADPEVS